MIIEPIFSIVIPIYNSEKTIKVCVESIINQDYKEYELLLVNDGSTDDSLKICREYERLHTNIKVYTKINRGVSSARNEGIKNVTGKYVTFIDSDDFIEKSFLSDFFEIIKEQEFDIVIANYILHYIPGGSKVRLDAGNIGFKNFEINKQIVYAEISGLLSGPFSKIYRSKLLKDSRLFFDESFHFGEDAIFNMSFLQYVKNIKIIDSRKYYYVQTELDSLVKRKYSFEKTNEYINKITTIRNATVKNFCIEQTLYFDFIQKEKTLYKLLAIQSMYLSKFKVSRVKRCYNIEKEITNLNLTLLPTGVAHYEVLKLIFFFTNVKLIDTLMFCYMSSRYILNYKSS
jgi:glycosyltransferase involved in cell wall biosynthesis